MKRIADAASPLVWRVDGCNPVRQNAEVLSVAYSPQSPSRMMGRGVIPSDLAHEAAFDFFMRLDQRR
jgi:hypothetical protein